MASSRSDEASSLDEIHGDWRLICIESGSGKRCRISQSLAEAIGGGVLTIDLASLPGGLVSGTVVLPFGLDLDAGIMIQIDDLSSIQATRFRTCVPAGCLVPVNLDAPMITAMRTGTALNFHALSDGDGGSNDRTDQTGKRVFSFSLQGVGAALDRARALAH